MYSRKHTKIKSMEKAYDDQPRLKLFETDSIFDSPTKKVLVFILLRGTIVSRTYLSYMVYTKTYL